MIARRIKNKAIIMNEKGKIKLAITAKIDNVKTGFFLKLRARLYQLMYQNAKSADEYLDLGKTTKLSIEVLPVHIK